jgi:hypothetical protein
MAPSNEAPLLPNPDDALDFGLNEDMADRLNHLTNIHLRITQPSLPASSHFGKVIGGNGLKASGFLSSKRRKRFGTPTATRRTKATIGFGSSV